MCSARLFLTSDSIYCHFFFLFSAESQTDLQNLFCLHVTGLTRRGCVPEFKPILCFVAMHDFYYHYPKAFFCTIALMQNILVKPLYKKLLKTQYFTVALQIRFSNTYYSSFNWSSSLLINTKPEVVYSCCFSNHAAMSELCLRILISRYAC